LLTRKRAIYLALELDRRWTETIGVTSQEHHQSRAS
jgi:hypothetical protein